MFFYTKSLETEENFYHTFSENRKTTEIMANAKFDCGRKNYYFQNFNNI